MFYLLPIAGDDVAKEIVIFFLAYISYIAYNILNKGAGRIACTYPLRRYVLSYKVTVQPLAGEWTVIFCAWNYSQAL